jgi:hypothetical protein
MRKTAQERSWLNKLREKTNLSGKVLESINPEFAQMMDNLRSTDEKIRNQASGIRNIVKWSRTLVNRRDYLSAALNISAFHERCRQIAFDLEQCKSKVNLKHYKFILDQFDDEYKEKLFGYDPEKSLTQEPLSTAEARAISDSLKKIASLSDFLSLPMSDMAQNLTNSRSIAMRALEKRFSVGFLKQLKNESNAMVDKTEDFSSYMMSLFRKLATALATRNAEDYIGFATDFIRKFANYHKLFVKYYNSNILPLKEKHEEQLRQNEEDKAKALEQQADRIRAIPDQTPQAPNGFPDAKERGRVLQDLDSRNEPKAPDVPNDAKHNALNELERLNGGEDETGVPNISPDSVAPKPGIKTETKLSHSKFIERLEKLASSNSIQSIVDAMLKYAAIVEEHNENDALKLIAIAEGVIDDNYALFGKTEKKTVKEDKAVKPSAPAIADPLALTPPPARSVPVDHGIPEGTVNQKYFSIPFLKNITADKIRITPAAAAHISNMFIKRLFDLNFNVSDFGSHLEQKILTELKLAIVRGIVLTSAKTEDPHNPRDRYLEIYSYVNLPSIDRKLKGIVKMKIWCRLSAFSGTLSIRTIQKNFQVE